MNWHDWIIHNELIVKLTVFLGVFFLMAAWEQLAPCRTLTISKSLRWINNLGLVLLNGVVLRLLFPAGGHWNSCFCATTRQGIIELLPNTPVCLDRHFHRRQLYSVG